MGAAGLRIAVVGTSGAGKSTLARLLAERGYAAYAVAQEHSLVGDLWRRRAPDLLVYLECSYEALAQRRPVTRGWDWMAAEQERLAHARRHADLRLSTDRLPPNAVVERVEELVRRRGAGESGGAGC